MWQYLSPPHSILLVWKLVQDGWGLRSLEDSVQLHKQSVSFAWIEEDVVLSLANLSRESQTMWELRYWLNPIWRQQKHKKKMIQIFTDFIRFGRGELGIRTIVARTDRLSAVRLCVKNGARYVGGIQDAYAVGKNGYIIVWEAGDGNS